MADDTNKTMVADDVSEETEAGTAENIAVSEDKILTWDEFKVSRRLSPLREWRVIDSTWYDHTVDILNEFTGEQLTVGGITNENEAELERSLLGYNLDSHYDTALTNEGILKKYAECVTFAQYGTDGHGDCGMLLPIFSEEEASKKVREGKSNGCIDAALVVEGTTLVGIINADSLGSAVTLVVPYGIETIGDSAFSYGVPVNVRKIVLPFTVTRLADRAFAYTNITTVELSPNIIDIGARAFAFSAIEYVALPDKVQVIKESTFESCKNLASIVFPRWLVTIERNAFAGCCRVFADGFALPKSLIYIDEAALPDGKYKVNPNQHLITDAVYVDTEHILIRSKREEDSFVFDDFEDF